MFSNYPSIKLNKITIESEIFDQFSKVIINQEYINELEETAIEAEYVFPIYANATIINCEFILDTSKITCKIEESDIAKKEYNNVLDKGNEAILLQSNSNEILKMNVGNIKKQINVIITYIVENQIDLEYTTDNQTAYRFIIPTTIEPRYQSTQTEITDLVDISYGSEFEKSLKSEVNTKCDIIIKSINTLQIKKSYNNNTGLDISINENQIIINQKNIKLDRDYILIYAIDRSKDILIVDQESLYCSIDISNTNIYKNAPKELIKGNYVILIDQSGSMFNNRIIHAVNAAKILLNSLEEGSKFNVYGFGSDYYSFFPELVDYNELNVNKAKELFNTKATKNLGGTEMKLLFESVLNQIMNEIPTFIYLLSDGEISTYDQKSIVNMLQNNKINKNIKVSCLGIGYSVSHNLIESLSRVTGGLYQTTTYDENIENKTINLLKNTSINKLISVTTDIDSTINEFIDNGSIYKLFINNNTKIKYIKVKISNFSRTSERDNINTIERIIPININRNDNLLSCILANNKIKNTKNITKIIELSKKYNILTEYTSFIGVKEDTDSWEIINILKNKIRKVKIPLQKYKNNNFIISRGASTLSSGRSSRSRSRSNGISLNSGSLIVNGGISKSRSNESREITKSDLLKLLSNQEFDGHFKYSDKLSNIIKDMVKKIIDKYPNISYDISLTIVIIMLMENHNMVNTYDITYNKIIKYIKKCNIDIDKIKSLITIV